MRKRSLQPYEYIQTLLYYKEMFIYGTTDGGYSFSQLAANWLEWNDYLLESEDGPLVISFKGLWVCFCVEEGHKLILERKFDAL